MKGFPHIPEPRAEAVRYEPARGLVVVSLKGGGTVAFAARTRPELSQFTEAMLSLVTTDHIGFYIHWPATHVSLYVPALLASPRD